MGRLSDFEDDMRDGVVHPARPVRDGRDEYIRAMEKALADIRFSPYSTEKIIGIVDSVLSPELQRLAWS